MTDISQRIAEGLGHHNPTRRDYVYRRARAGVPEGGGGPMIEPVLTCRHCRFTVRPEEGRLGEHGPVNNRCPGSNKPIAEAVTEHDFKEYGKYRRDYVYRVKAPCKPGYEGMWCHASHHCGGVSFWYFTTQREAEESMARK